MVHLAHHPISAFITPRLAGPTLLVRLWQRLVLWRERELERSQLAALTARELRDIGLSRIDVLAEVNKPFWRG
jgi:uncharacterized protein YjiS (DUF1127 family)